jgi:hypothetical protein
MSFETEKVCDIVTELKDRTNWDPPSRSDNPFRDIGKKDEFPLNQMHERWMCPIENYTNLFPLYGYDQHFYEYVCKGRRPIEITKHKEFCIGGFDECGSKLVLKCIRQENKWTCEPNKN